MSEVNENKFMEKFTEMENLFSAQRILGQCTISMPPKNVRKPKFF